MKSKVNINIIMIITVISFISFLGVLPYLVGLAFSTTDIIPLSSFMGKPHFSQMMILEQIKQGNILVRNLFTSESQPNLLLPLSYLPFGLLGYLLSIESTMLILLEKIIFGTLFIFSALSFLKFFFRERIKIILALFLLLFASGFGFLMHNFINSSTDLWVSETLFLPALWNQPNTVFYFSILFLISYLFILSYQDKNTSNVQWLTIILLLTVFEKPQIIIVMLLSMIITILIKETDRKKVLTIFKKFWISLILPAVLLLLVLLLYYNTKIVWNWLSQAVYASPSFINYVSGFGLLGIFTFLFFLKNDIQKLSVKYIFFFSWILSVVILIYTPLNQQRIFDIGIFIPLCILSVEPIFQLISILQKKFITKKYIYWVVIIFTAVLLIGTNVYIFYLTYNTFLEKPKDSPVYIYQEDKKAFDFLKQNSNAHVVILADAVYSHLIPGYTGRAVYFAERSTPFMTINQNKKIEQVRDFFFYSTDPERIKFLHEKKISHFFLGKKEADPKDLQSWDQKKYLKKIYQGDGVRIYKVL